MEKATAIAPSNIAFIKYWGRENPELNIPKNGSLSVNLDQLHTTTTVEFSPDYQRDQIIINGHEDETEAKRAIKHLDKIRLLAGITEQAKVVSENNFPTGSGLASSASGFAALSVAGAKAAGLNLSERELSTLARLGSGSASRSIPDGFVEWVKGSSHENSYAYSLYPPDYWDIKALAVIVSLDKKKMGSVEGHSLVDTSIYYGVRIVHMDGKIAHLKEAMAEKDFKTFGEIVEAEAVDLHVIAMTSNPPLFYWKGASIEAMEACRELRDGGTLAYFTFDAGPQPVVFCQGKDAQTVAERLKSITAVKDLIVNEPGIGARVVDTHLF